MECHLFARWDNKDQFEYLGQAELLDCQDGYPIRNDPKNRNIIKATLKIISEDTKTWTESVYERWKRLVTLQN